MKTTARLSLILLLSFAIVPCLQAQMQAPKPADELKKADYFAGTWKLVGDMVPGPMGPGGKMSMTEDCHWQKGGFFLICDSTFSSASQSGASIAVMGYDVTSKAYTYDEYNSTGEAVRSTGSFDGQTWTWTNKESMGGKAFTGRFVMKVTSPTSYSFTYEMSADGTNWTKLMDGKATKAR